MSKNQFTGIATQPQRNRKLCQFNKDCILIDRGTPRHLDCFLCTRRPYLSKNMLYTIQRLAHAHLLFFYTKCTQKKNAIIPTWADFTLKV